MSKSKSGGRGESFKSLVTKWERDLRSFRKDLADQLNKNIKKFTTRIEEYERQLGQVVATFTQQISMLTANLGILQQATEHLDIRGQIHGRLLLETFARFQQVDRFLQKMGVSAEDLSAADLEDIKREAREVYEASFQQCAALVLEMREAELAARRQQAEEAAQKQVDEQEQSRAEAELQAAESPSLVPEAQVQGPEIPDGAEIFGG